MPYDIYVPIKRSFLAEGPSRNNKPKERDRADEALKSACQLFEGFLLAEICKSQLAVARALGPNPKGPFHQLEEIALDVVCEQVSSRGGVGFWKFLYEEIATDYDGRTEK